MAWNRQMVTQYVFGFFFLSGLSTFRVLLKPAPPPGTACAADLCPSAMPNCTKCRNPSHVKAFTEKVKFNKLISLHLRKMASLRRLALAGRRKSYHQHIVYLASAAFPAVKLFYEFFFFLPCRKQNDSLKGFY